jgi:3-deoxy-D-manno-octulosonic-acid transferase
VQDGTKLRATLRATAYAPIIAEVEPFGVGRGPGRCPLFGRADLRPRPSPGQRFRPPEGLPLYCPVEGASTANAVYFIYNVALAIGFVLALPWFLWKGRATGKYLRTFRERMGRLPVYLNVDAEPSIWVHAVSVGEVLAVRPLIPALKQRYPGHRVFLSTTTMTGNLVAQKSVRGIDGLFYAPFDWPGAVRKALAVLNPTLLVLVETELWPNLIHEAQRRGTRVAVVNGRISPKSFAGYRRIRSFLRKVLGEVDLFLMQGEAHAERIRELGAPQERVHVTGNLKFDSVEAGRTPERLARVIAGEVRRGRPLWVAGSTVTGEEELILEAYHRVRERVPDVGLVLAPRHPERFPEVPALVESAGFRCLRRTTLEPGAWRDAEVVLLDTLGELAQLYPLATVVFVGGSLVPSGGHNILEPAVAGKPVIVGPHMQNFQEIADKFRAEGALVQVETAEDLAREVTSLLTDDLRRRSLGERAKELVDRNRGALRNTLDGLARLVA